MPHLIIEYSSGLDKRGDVKKLMRTVYDAAVASEVMDPADIKVRATPFSHYRLHNSQDSFVHTTCRLLAGRTPEQKIKLAELIRKNMADLMPNVYSISVEIVDMDPASYKKRLLDVV
jgi:5-carboxymethyl-2-hydroxymuconate isomerase